MHPPLQDKTHNAPPQSINHNHTHTHTHLKHTQALYLGPDGKLERFGDDALVRAATGVHSM